MTNEIEITNESLEQFNHDKNVVGITHEELVSCPINNGADLNSDCMLDCLFDDGQYTEEHFCALGFIRHYPFMVEYKLNDNFISLQCLVYINKEETDTLTEEIKDRLSDEQVFPKVGTLSDDINKWLFFMYYRPEYAVKFNS